MIVNFKIFENNYKYMSPEDEEEFSEYITPQIMDYLDKKISKLNIGDFVSSHFNYREVIDNYIFDIYFFKKMYSYVRHNMSSDARTPEIYNSFNKILDNIISDSVIEGYKTNVYMKIEDRLIKIYDRTPKLYKNHIDWYGDKISTTVKDKLKYIIDSEKYNL